MAKKDRIPTMKDVAEEAGVALGTVSKVLSGRKVGAAYAEKVNRAVAKLNYAVNPYARSLKSSKTFTVALIIPNIYHVFYAGLTHYVNQSLLKRGYHLLLCTTDGDPGSEQAFISSMRKSRADGMIVLSYAPSLHFSGSLPVVSIDRRFSPEIPCVSSDNFGGGRMAAEKLIRNGCRNLAYLSLMTDVQTEVAKRREGFMTFCREKEIACTAGEFTGSDNFSLIREFLEAHRVGAKLEFDGIFCVSDPLAYQTVRYLNLKGIRVPENVQVIGYDGLRRFGYLELSCSTIVQPLPEIAEKCVELLMEKGKAGKDGRNAVPLVCLPVSFAYGGTTTE